ncbi:MAG: hypothetical protein VKN72_22530 [Nostocales cyanobacterium 94392]|nr:hypothetical protein [Nostocales cyanobacterium 94392]
MFFKFTAALVFGIIASTSIGASATEAKVENYDRVSTSAADLGGTIKLDCNIRIRFIQSEDCPTGGENFQLDIPQKTYTLEQERDKQDPNRYLILYEIKF